MTSEATRRKFLNLFRLAATAGLLPPEMLSGQVVPKSPAPPNQPNNNLSQSISDAVNAHQKELERATQDVAKILNQPPPLSSNTGPTIGAAPPSVPNPVFKDLDEPDGATREDFPADYTKFDPQTGLFGEEGDAALPVGF
jgi:hypothetical protein